LTIEKQDIIKLRTSLGNTVRLSTKSEDTTTNSSQIDRTVVQREASIYQYQYQYPHSPNQSTITTSVRMKPNSCMERSIQQQAQQQ
jgi:hypothetical protein